MTNEEAIKQLEFLIKIDFHVDTKEACRTAISALEKQIKLNEIGFTEEVIENYKIFEDECITKGFTFKSLLDAIDKQINGGCVKCSERLPDIELNQAKAERGNNAVYPTLITKEVTVKGKLRRIVDKAFYFSDNYDYGFSDKYCNTIDNIIAWQNLPTPYQESEVL